jgi:hypothetical protein
MKSIVGTLLLLSLVSSSASAAPKIIGKGSQMRFDTSKWSPDVRANYEVMENRCTKCHTLERIITPFVTGLTMSGQVFDWDSMKIVLFKMFNKPKSDISTEDRKHIVAVMKHLMNESTK